MKSKEPKLIVSLYLRGQALDPEAVTHVIGILPTSVQSSGHRKVTSSGREFTTKLGVWSLSVELDSSSLDAHLAQLARDLPYGVNFASIPGVNDAYFDVFVALATDLDGEAKGEFDISQVVLGVLARLGLPVRITITAGQD